MQSVHLSGLELSAKGLNPGAVIATSPRCELTNRLPMNRQPIFYLSILLATIAIIFFTTSQARLSSPNTQNSVLPTQQRTAILYSITDLGTLGGKESYASGINDLGQVVGSSLTSKGKKHAFLWDKSNGMQQLDPDSSFQVNAMKINKIGQVVGMRWKKQDADSIEGIVWDSNNRTSIKYGKVASFNDLNDAGQVVGKLPYLDYENLALLWNSPDDIEYLGIPRRNSIPKKNSGSEANRINNASKVVGAAGSCVKWPCGFHAFLWDRENGMSDLGTLGSHYSEAYGINDREQVVGVSSVRDGEEGELRAFLWEKTNGMQNLGTFDNQKSYALDINNVGQVVGFVEDEPLEGVAFLWDKTYGLQDLNNLIDPKAGWRLLRAEDINEKGWIVGTGWFNENRRAFLLTPKVSKK